jgi:uncharacterized protein (DUF1786 family)
MQLLLVDVGTGTQDILLYDSARELENCFKLVLPSPTLQVAARIRAATRAGRALVLTGTTMGGGPSQWAARDHAAAGLPVYATPDAARSFNDELDAVEREMGIRIVGADEAAALAGQAEPLELKDVDLPAILGTFAAGGAQLALDGLAAAVFDHGNAPPGYSDRQFRFDFLQAALARAEGLALDDQLAGFAYPAAAVPPELTRLRAVAASLLAAERPAVVMDTAPAAVLGARCDPAVARLRHALVANVGNFHTLAFRLGPDGIGGLFEHHTGEIDRERLDDLLARLAAGTLTHAEVFDDMGHGALVRDPAPLDTAGPDYGVAVVGPRRSLLRGSRHAPYFAVPFGDMMIAGCFGLLRAYARLVPETRETILASLAGTPRGAPWD